MKNIVTPLIYKQTKYSDYGVCKVTGNVYSVKTGEWKPLKWKISGRTGKYPQVNLSLGSNTKTIFVHVAAHETLNPRFPKPPGVPAKDWTKTPTSVKVVARELYEVNHIDHNPVNFSPKNLEWTTALQNVQKYQQYRVGTL